MTDPRPTPTFAGAVFAGASLRIRTLLRGRLVWLAVVAATLVVASGLVVIYGGDHDPVEATQKLLLGPFRRLLVVLVPFLLSVTAVSEEVEAKTLVYLDCRPVSRATVLLGKYLAGTALAWAILVGALLVLYLGARVTDVASIFAGPDVAGLGRGAAMILVGSAYYGAMTLFWGALLVDVPYLLGLLFFALFDLALGWFPGALRLGSIGHHLANLLGDRSITHGGIALIETPEIGAGLSGLVVVLATALFVALASLVFSSSQYAYSRAAG